MHYVLCIHIVHLYGSESYNHEKVNLMRYQVIEVKDGDSAIN